MRLLVLFLRFIVVVVPVLSGSLQGAFAQDAGAGPAGWQTAITGQIEAFRQGDAEGALEYAGTSFKIRYRDASDFYADIKRSGYRPIVDSRSHSFGPYEMTEDANVFQIVEIQGPDQGLYRALYQLAQEPEGWRVQSVVLRKKPGVGI